MKTFKQHILEKLKVTKSGPMELTFEQLRKAMLDCKERNKISNRFSVALNTGEFKEDPLYTKIDSEKPIARIFYREDKYDEDGSWLKLALYDPTNYNRITSSRHIIEIADNQDLHKILSDETIERIYDYLETVNNITEKLKVSKNRDVEFDEVVELFQNVIDSGDTFSCKVAFGEKPIIHTDLADRTINKEFKKYDEYPIEKIGFINGNEHHGPCIFFIVSDDGNDMPLGVQNYEDLVNCIGQEWIDKIKSYLTKNAKH